MTEIEDILKLPTEKQIAIMEAIQDNLDDFDNDIELSAEHIAFIKDRIKSIETTNQPTYTWEQVKENLKNRWNTQ